MGQITLDEQARAKIMTRLEGAAAAKAPKRHVRPLRAALLAACVCLVLAGSVFAGQGILGAVFRGGDRNNYNVSVGGLMAFATENLGPRMAQDLQDTAAVDFSGDVRKAFYTFQELEDYTGLSLAYNPVLEESVKLMYPTDENDLSKGYEWYEGEDLGEKPLYRYSLSFWLWGGKLLNGDVEMFSQLDGMDIRMDAEIYGEADGAPPESFEFGGSYGGENDFRAEEYVMKNGSQAQLIYRYANKGSDAPLSCDAYFAWNGIRYFLHFYCLDVQPVDPAMVERVMDAFE